MAGPNFMPLAYRDTPLARLMPFDPAQARNPEPGKLLDRRVRRAADRDGAGQPGDATGRLAGAVAGHLAEAAADVLDDGRFAT